MRSTVHKDIDIDISGKDWVQDQEKGNRTKLALELIPNAHPNVSEDNLFISEL